MVDIPLHFGRMSEGKQSMATDVCAHIAGTVWKIIKNAGDQVEQEEPVLILESMKMEMPVESPGAGTIAEIRVEEGDSVQEGQTVAVLE